MEVGVLVPIVVVHEHFSCYASPVYYLSSIEGRIIHLILVL